MEKTLDPRVIRTRRLIMDAFIDLSMQKEFKGITIKDITEAATINRATFYYHFTNKYDLLEKVLSEDILREVVNEVKRYEYLSEETIESIFKSIIQFQVSISNQCRRSYEAFTPMIETLLKQELEEVFTAQMSKQWPNQSKEALRVGAIMMTWALYGAAMNYMKNESSSLEAYIQQMMPFITNGMQLG